MKSFNLCSEMKCEMSENGDYCIVDGVQYLGKGTVTEIIGKEGEEVLFTNINGEELYYSRYIKEDIDIAYRREFYGHIYRLFVIEKTDGKIILIVTTDELSVGEVLEKPYFWVGYAVS